MAFRRSGGTFFRRLIRRWDRLVGIDFTREAITVAVPLLNQDWLVSGVSLHVLPGIRAGSTRVSDVAVMLRGVLPHNIRRCAIGLDASEILLSPLAKSGRADRYAEKGVCEKEKLLPFDSYGYLTRVLELEARYILAIKNSRVRRYRGVARGAGLDVDVLTSRGFSIGMGLESLGVFSRDRKGALIELSTNAMHISLYSDGFPFEMTTRSVRSADGAVEYLMSCLEGTAFTGMPCGVVGGTEELRTMIRRSIEAASSMTCIDVDAAMNARVVGVSGTSERSLGTGALSSFGLCCIE